MYRQAETLGATNRSPLATAQWLRRSSRTDVHAQRQRVPDVVVQDPIRELPSRRGTRLAWDTPFRGSVKLQQTGGQLSGRGARLGVHIPRHAGARLSTSFFAPVEGCLHGAGDAQSGGMRRSTWGAGMGRFPHVKIGSGQDGLARSQFGKHVPNGSGASGAGGTHVCPGSAASSVNP